MARNYQDYTYIAIKNDWSELWIEQEDGKHVKYTAGEMKKIEQTGVFPALNKIKKIFGGEII